eukprot:jgi/Ulvmu1/2165/UM013_0009.1
MATATTSGRSLALGAGALLALIASIATPEAPLRPTKIIQQLLKFVLRKSEEDVQLTEHQRELLKGNERLLSQKEIALLQMLMEEGQGHVLGFWAEVGTHDDRKRTLARQLATIDAAYPGGLRTYITNARRLLESACRGDNPYEQYTPEVPAGVTLSVAPDGRSEFEAYEELGLQTAQYTAFVLVAGGLGERLGYGGIKVSLPVDTASMTCFLEHYIHHILALQRASGARKPLPLAIMTSDDTHAATAALLKQHDYFGARPRQVHLMKQGRVPCLADPAGHLALETADPYALEVKPHGHGDVHALLHQHGLARQWLQDGFKWVAFFQDTNAMVFRGLLPTLGVSQEKQWDMNSLCVPRVAKEAIGAICTLRHANGSSMTINVEYNQLGPLLQATVNPEGDVNDSSGFSPFPGNINQLVLKLDTYATQLDATGGVIAEFVNPKFKDATRAAFKKPTRLECMMQDYPKALPPTATVGFTTIKEVWATYMPVKNSPAEARAKAQQNAPTHSATHAEFSVYDAWGRLLRSAGATVATGARASFNGLDVTMCPFITFAPSFVCALSEMRERFPQPERVSVTARSTLAVRGDAVIHHLDLDGALVIAVDPGASLTVRSLVVRNQGWTLEAVKEDGPEEERLRVRGFKMAKRSGLLLRVRSGAAAVDAVEDRPGARIFTPQERREEWCPPP